MMVSAHCSACALADEDRLEGWEDRVGLPVAVPGEVEPREALFETFERHRIGAGCSAIRGSSRTAGVAGT